MEGDLTDAAIRLCVAYLMARSVMLVVKSRLVAYFIAAAIMLLAFLQATGFAQYTFAYLDSMGFDIGKFHISLLNLFHGIFILVIVFWIAGVLSRTLESYLRRSSTLSYMARELSVKFFRIFVYFIAFMITLSAIGVDLTAFAVFGGALGVGVGLGLQKITANFVSGITLLMEKSIKIGDLIEIAGNSGWVRQLNIRYTLIETAEGKEILIPNEELISTRVINWSHTSNQARVDIKIMVEYGSSAAKVKEVLLSAARMHPLCLKTPAPNCWLREFSDSGLQFLLVFWIADVHEGRYGPQSEVMMNVLEKFAKEGIVIPTSQTNLASNPATA
jgi:small-conductance mechanosensitive channel